MKNLKKITLLTLILFTAFGLSACGDKENELEVSPQNYRESYEGVIEKAALSAYTEGTHRIIAEDGAYLIQSSTFNLNQYEGKEVIVSGTLKKGVAGSEPVLNVEKIQLTTISFEAPLSDYQSKTYDFKFQYPQTWKVNETDLGLVITFEGDPWVNINVYNQQSHLETFVPEQEDKQGVEVTVAHQRAIRFNDSDSLRLYVEHPPTDRVYRIRFDAKAFSDPKKQALFYDLLGSFEFIYSPQKADGPPCGGVENKQCSEDYRCELASASIDAVGVCVPLSGSSAAGSCPFIAAPSGCPEYRVVEYNGNGCPFRYECLEEGLAAFDSIELAPTATEETSKQEDDEDALEPETSSEKEQEDSTQSSAEKEYTIPPVSSVTGQYTTKSGLSIKYPKSWYFYNFGSQGIGFAPTEFESFDQAVMVLKTGSGDLTRELDGQTYGISGPSDLNPVMQAILDSIE